MSTIEVRPVIGLVNLTGEALNEVKAREGVVEELVRLGGARPNIVSPELVIYAVIEAAKARTRLTGLHNIISAIAGVTKIKP